MDLRSTPRKMSREERRYSIPHGPHTPLPPAASEDLHAWSIYSNKSFLSFRQNLNSDFTDSALGSSDKSPLPYGNFQLRDTTVQSILNHPRYGPKSPLGSNMYAYLKFGLPRVFPPNAGSQRSHKIGPGHNRGRLNRGFRDSSGITAGSSGYDSSDNETTQSRIPPNLRKYRSESDFRNIDATSPSRINTNIPSSALRQVNSRASIAGTHLNTNYMPNIRPSAHKSHSEADLLVPDIGYDYESRIYASSRGRSEQQTMARKQSNLGLIYPNIQIHSLDVTHYLKGITLQAKASDVFAIMATSQREGTLLMECLAGLRRRISGEILINGQQMYRKDLRELCGYIPLLENSSLDSRMSVQSALSYHANLRGPLDRSDLKERIEVLVEDLGLAAVRATNISRLTYSEKQRLNVACQLLTQTSFLILDQVTTNMDIFDTFFLVEYLRQWCNGGRIVIMTLQPPTFEILSMCTSVLLLSGGRTIFSGSRSDLPRHMGSLGYPCPPYKNPADYYLDLVTLDDLSAAAMLESSARIESLANSWTQLSLEIPLAAPPSSLPAFTKSAGFFGQMKALIKRFMVYKQPGSLLSWISKLIFAAVLSLIIGCIFWDVPSSDPQLNFNDRLGYHHCMLSVALWPILMMLIRDIHIDKLYAKREINLGMYSKGLYVCIQSLFGLFPNLCIWLAYLLPAHSMAALYSYVNNSDTGIYIYMGNMLLYLITIQTIVLLCCYLMPAKVSSVIFSAIILMFTTITSGLSLHPRQLAKHWLWAKYISPQKWLLPILVADEYSTETLTNIAGLQLCRNKQVQHQEIIVQQPCPPPNGTQVLVDFLLLPENHVLDSQHMQHSTIIAFILASFILFIILFVIYTFSLGFSGNRKKRR